MHLVVRGGGALVQWGCEGIARGVTRCTVSHLISLVTGIYRERLRDQPAQLPPIEYYVASGLLHGAVSHLLRLTSSGCKRGWQWLKQQETRQITLFCERRWRKIKIGTVHRIDVVFSRLFSIRTATEIAAQQVRERELSLLELVRNLFPKQCIESLVTVFSYLLAPTFLPCTILMPSLPTFCALGFLCGLTYRVAQKWIIPQGVLPVIQAVVYRIERVCCHV